MRAQGVSLVVFVVVAALAPSVARADSVKLMDGRVLKRVKVTVEDARVTVAHEHGSTVFALEEVDSIAIDEHWQDRKELSRRTSDAGVEPGALREVAAWCDEHGLEKEGAALVARARSLWLERRLAEAHTAADLLALVHDMEKDAFPEAERTPVLERALALAPEDADVRAALGQVKREGEWVSLARAAEIDAAAEAREMEARGLVRFEGRWRTPAQIAAIESRREAEVREHELADERREQARADARRETAKLEAIRVRDSAPAWRIDAMPEYPPHGWHVYPVRSCCHRRHERRGCGHD